jgi:hypothetical protein
MLLGQDIQPTRDMTRFVKWPEYVRLQRQKVVLNQRLKVPPAIAQLKSVLAHPRQEYRYAAFQVYEQVPSGVEAGEEGLVRSYSRCCCCRQGEECQGAIYLRSFTP